jgi:uncharacterized protein (DUF362 family)/Pyruvate/2-oxoacid:ferredoxin oxidoreductase delta subunit
MKSSVSIVRCASYDEAEVFERLRQSIDLIGGIHSFVKKDNRVLLKPHLLCPKGPEKAVTTHPSILRGMIRLVREAGGIPSIGDGPAIMGTVRTAEKAGIKAVADEMECPVVEFNRPMLSSGGKVYKQLEIDQTVLEADVVINLPKFKTHSMMMLTLGVKNLFGCIPGTRKAFWHFKAGHDREAFAQILLDLYQIIHPSLTVLDGVIGMEGNGPQNGQPVSLGLILSSSDALNVDLAVCDLLGISRKSLLTNRMAFERGIRKDEIAVFGERMEDVKISGFRFPTPSQTDLSLPVFLRRVLDNALTSRPVIEKKICKSCNRCEEICPPRALKKVGRKLIFDYRQCIHCFCCQEICPEGAITIKPGWILKLVGGK